MSFFYLQGFEQNNLQHFYQLYDLLKIANPHLVV